MADSTPLGPPSYPRNREHALSLLRISAAKLDDGDTELALIAHSWARAYINDHPSEFPEYIQLPLP